ncbi:MAG: efflux RND transporter periplasmic adaptor subunit [Fibrobacteria bacterium]
MQKSPASTVLSDQAGIKLIRYRFEDSIEAPVRIETDERRSRLVTSPAAGRIESVAIRSSDQAVQAGETIATLYSPEIVTAQREFMLVQKSGDAALREGAASRLRRMGLLPMQLQTLLRTGKALDRLPIPSPASGYLVPAADGTQEGEPNRGGMGATPSGSGASMESMGGKASGGAAETGSPGSQATASDWGGLRAGAYVVRGAPLARINDLKTVAASLALPLDKAGLLREGDSIEISIPALGFTSKTRLDYLEARVTEGKGSLTAKTYLPNPGSKLKLGALGTAHLVARPDSAWVLPRSAVHDLGDRKIAWVRASEDSTAFQAREVRIGRMGSKFIEIIAGLAPGQAVAENASLLLDPDAVIEPIPISDPEATSRPDDHSEHVEHPDHADHGKKTYEDPKAAPGESHTQHGSGSPSANVPLAAHAQHASGHSGTLGPEMDSAQDQTPLLKLTAEEEQLAGIRTQKAKVGPISPSSILRGTTQFDARSSETVAAKVEGLIEQVEVRRSGQKVSKGQVLGRIQSETLQSALQEYLMVIAQSKSLPDGGMARAQVQATYRRLRVLGMSDLQIREFSTEGREGMDSKSLPLVSPREGVVLEVLVQPGQYVTEGTPLFTIGGSPNIWIETWMLPDETAAFPEGTEAWVQIEGDTGSAHRGHLEHMQQGTSVSGSLGVGHVGIPNPDGRILPGLQAWVTLKGPGRTALTTQTSALLRSSGSTMVWVRTGTHSYSPRMVKLGLSTSEAAEIKGGIQEGEDIVIAGAYLLNSEWTIRNGAVMSHGGH